MVIKDTSSGVLPKFQRYFIARRSLTLLIAFTIINIVLIIDNSIVRISTFTGGIYPFWNYLFFFVFTYSVYATASLIIIRLVKNNIHTVSRSKSVLMKSFFAGITTTNYTILILIFILILQIFMNKYYSLWLLESIAFNSYLIGAIMLSVLSYKIISWYRRNSSLVLLLYFIGISIISINSIIIVSSLQIQLDSKPEKIVYTRSLSGGFAPSQGILIVTQEYLLVASFSLIWLATTLLMKNYSNRKQMIKYWLIMLISLVYFIGQFELPYMKELVNFSIINNAIGDVGYTIFMAAIRPSVGILFGIVFWFMSRKISNPITREYLLITGFGMMLIFASNQPAGLTLTALPPFGLMTAGFFGLATYLLFIGLYSSAVSVSHDSLLRKQARAYAGQLILLDKIGTPEMKQHAESLVSNVMKNFKSEIEDMVDNSGVLPSIDENNFKEYLESIIKEVKKKK